MSDWPDGWTEPQQRGGATEPHPVVGQVLGQGAFLPQQRPAPPPLPPDMYPPRAAHGHAGVPPQLGNTDYTDHRGDAGSAHGYDRRYAPDDFRPDDDDLRSGARRTWPRRLIRTTAFLVSALLVTAVGTYIWADSELNRAVEFSKVEDRPLGGKGTNYLIVGSDSREGLSGQDKKALHTGSAEGRRTDSIILLHTGAQGTTMMSLPRDSWVTIPPFTRPDTGKRPGAMKNKLNAAFAEGGPELLVRTVEFNTGLKIDHYAEIGFAGFVNIVDAVGGVEVCLDKDLKDEKSGADFKKGCQTLDGSQSLAFVRQRHQEAQGDLGRAKNQQKFLAALADQAAAPATLLAPWKIYGATSAGLDTLIVDNGMGLPDLTSMSRAVKDISGGNGKQINVPVADMSFRTRKGSAVKWDVRQAGQLFEELKNDQPVAFDEKKARPHR